MSPRRAPSPVLDVEAILSTLARHRVDYVLIGGIAATLHGSPRATWGLDLTPAPSRENLSRLAAALRELGAEGIDVPSEAGSLTTTTRAGRVGVWLAPAGGQSYETLTPNAETYHVFGLRVRAASLGDVIRSKLAVARNTDLANVSLLLELQRRRG